MNSLDELFHKVVDGEKGAESELFRLLLERFTTIAKSRLRGDLFCEDVVSEACQTVLQKLGSGAIEPNKFRAYALAVLRNKIGNHLKKEKIRKQLAEHVGGIEDEQPGPPEDPMRRKTIMDCLKKIAGPHPEYVRVVKMIVDGYTSEEICHKLAIKRNTYYVWLFRARKLLKKCLKEGGAL